MEILTLSDEDISNYILEILVGKRYYLAQDLDKDILLFTFPSGKQRLYANFLEKQLIVKYISEGFISEKDIDSSLVEEFFSIEDQNELEELISKLKSYKILLNKRKKNSIQYLEDENKIIELNKRVDELYLKKTNIKQYTAEYKAREEKYLNLFINNVYTTENKLKWNSILDFEESMPSLTYFYTILNDYLDFYFGLDIAIIRKIARSNQWMNYYKSAIKTGNTLFSKSSEDYSLDQLHLLSWSIFYTEIMEMSFKDRPSEELLDNDEKLDQYLEQYSKKIKAEIALDQQESKFKTNSLGKDQHLIVTAESENYVKFHKANMYSDTSIVSNKVKDDKSNYNEINELKKMKRKLSGK